MKIADGNARLLFLRPAEFSQHTLPLRPGSIKIHYDIQTLFYIFYHFNWSGRANFLFCERDLYGFFPLRILRLWDTQHWDETRFIIILPYTLWGTQGKKSEQSVWLSSWFYDFGCRHNKDECILNNCLFPNIR